MMQRKSLLILILLLFSATCRLGVDVSQLFSTSVYQCFKNDGYSFVIIRGYRSGGSLDPNIHANLQNAKAAGLTPDIYMFPCRGKSADSQVDQMISGISSSSYGMVWIDVETNPTSGCGWGTNHASNCEYLAEIVKRIKSHGKTPGIYASHSMWQTIMGSATACAGLGGLELWYAHYDGKPSFGDFQAFGGWKTPHIKQYQGDVTLCGAGVDKNYRA
jgi:GH25 family lysozyme M1 (1,4-beta-N-acetylmuramidase)